MLPNGSAVKRGTHIDIPLEIGLPHFISDDDMSGDGPAFGNFKLSLQSVVCHQGVSLDSGHYISFVRHPDPESQGEDHWMRFDDLARERVVEIEIEEQLTRESPYLLFYQVMPIEGELDRILNGGEPINQNELPPSYADSTGSKSSKVDSGVGDVTKSTRTGEEGCTSGDQPSVDTSISGEGKHGRSSMASDRRQSIAPSDTVNGSVRASCPSIDVASIDSSNNVSAVGSTTDSKVPNDVANTLTVTQCGSKPTRDTGRKSRPSSQAGESRLSTSFSRLANRMSRDKLGNIAIPQSPVMQTEKPSCANASTRASLDCSATSRSGSTVEVETVTQDRTKLKKEARAKSTKEQQEQQQQQQHVLLKGKKPDRECVIM